MVVYSVSDDAFKKYGRVVKGYDCTDLLQKMQETPLPEDVIYEPSVKELESLEIYKELTERAYGGLPIQIGYCNGNNHKLNAVEYHRSSEINVAVTDLILILGAQQDIHPDDYTYNTALMEAFLVPAGTMVEVYATSLHYAPCNAKGGFRCVVVLPRDTNLPLQKAHGMQNEDKLLFARNKWLIGHKDTNLGKQGAFIGLIGENITLD